MPVHITAAELAELERLEARELDRFAGQLEQLAGRMRGRDPHGGLLAEGDTHAIRANALGWPTVADSISRRALQQLATWEGRAFALEQAAASIRAGADRIRDDHRTPADLVDDHSAGRNLEALEQEAPQLIAPPLDVSTLTAAELAGPILEAAPWRYTATTRARVAELVRRLDELEQVADTTLAAETLDRRARSLKSSSRARKNDASRAAAITESTGLALAARVIRENSPNRRRILRKMDLPA